MKKIIRNPNRRAPVPSKPSAGKANDAAPSRRKKIDPATDTGHRKILIFLLIGLFLVIGIFILQAARSPRSAVRHVAVSAPTTRGERPYEPYRPKELGGLTIAEWMRQHAGENQELKERQERVRQYETGQMEQQSDPPAQE